VNAANLGCAHSYGRLAPRLTITIPGDLHAGAKAEAARTGRTLSEIFGYAHRGPGPADLGVTPVDTPRSACVTSRSAENAAVRDLLDEFDEDGEPRSGPSDAPMPTYGRGGLLPGINLDNSAEVRDYLDEFGEKSRL
jgi:hypothetical protein